MIARHAVADPPALFVPLTVVTELKRVLRVFCALLPDQFAAMIRPLLVWPIVQFEHRYRVPDAMVWHRHGMAFNGVLHLAGRSRCSHLLIVDNRRIVRGATWRISSPVVTVSKA